MTFRTTCGDGRRSGDGRLAAVWRRIGESDGFISLTEMLTVMAILLIVLGGLTQLMVSGTNAQTDMTRRFEAQQNARLALDKLRREIHCANTVTQMDDTALVTLTSYSGIKIKLGTYCRTGSGDVTWCTRATAGVTQLYRVFPATATCVGGIRWASYLVSGNVFSYTTPTTGERTTLGIDLWINRGGRRYRLQDDIVLRNKARQ